MLKTIKKALLLSSLVYTFVVSMSQIAQRAVTNIFSKTQIAPIALAKIVSQRASFHDSPIIRCPIISSISLLTTEDESGLTDDKDTENKNESSSDLREDKKNNQYRAYGIIDLRQEHEEITNWQPTSLIEKIQARHDYNASQSSQHSSDILHRIEHEEQHEAYVAKVKSTVSTYISDFQEIVQHKTSKIVDFNSLSSSQEIATQKAALGQRLCVLENKLLEFTQQNPKISFIADATQHGFYEIPYHIKERWTNQDYQQAFMALELKAEIEAIKAAMQECDWMINSVKREEHDFVSRLENASVDTIEQEIISDLTAKKEKMDGFIVAKKTELSKQNDKIKDIQEQLGSFYKRSEITQWWHKSTIAALVVQQKTAKEEQTKINRQLQTLYDEQKKYSGRIEHAQKIAHEKKELELQEIQLLQEKQDALTVHKEILKSQHDSCNFDMLTCQDPELAKQWTERQEALSKTIEQGYIQYEQEFHLAPGVIGFLATHGIDCKDLQNFFGTTLQQQLHGQMCDILSQAATQQAQFGYQSNLLTSVVNFADAAHDANKNNQVLLASRLLDVDCYLLKLNHQIIHSILNDPVAYAQATVSGIANGLSDVGHMLVHPGETIKGLGKAIYYVLETVALNTSQEVVDHPEIFEPMQNQRNAEIVQALQNLGEQFEKSTGPERAEALFRFGANIYGTEKVIQAVGKVCGAVQSQAKIMRTLEGVAGMLEEQGLTQEIIQAVEKAEIAVKENIAKSVTNELSNCENIATHNRYGAILKECEILTEAQLINELESCGWKISKKNNPVLYNNVDYYLKKACSRINTELEVSLLEEYKKMTQVVGNPEISVCMDIEHTVNISYKLTLDKSKTFYTVELKGGHLAGTMDKLLQEKLVEEIEKAIEFGNGCKQYKVKDLLSGTKITHTEFPPSWDAERIAQETTRLTENLIKNGSFSAKTKEAIKVMTEDGFELKIVADPNLEPLNHTCIAIENTTNRHIVTSHPVYKG